MAKGPVKNAQQANANWKAGMQAPQTAAKYQQGVNNVSQSPNAAAASPQAMAKYAQNTQAAIASGRMAAANNAVGLDKWKAAANKGAARLSTGAANNAEKHLAHAQKFQSVWQAQRDAAQAIPHDGSVSSAVARVQAAMQIAKQAAGKTS